MFKLYRIKGRSLRPELEDGDIVLALTWRRLWRLRPGGKVVFRHPSHGVLVKKIQEVRPDGSLFVVGSHAASLDSYEFGPVGAGQVMGVVVGVWKKRF